MNKKIAILTDSSCDTSDAIAKEHGIHVLRMPIALGYDEYTEGVDLKMEDLKAFLRKDGVVRTSQVPLGFLLHTYDKLLEEYDQILHLPISKGLSGMYETALAQARNYEGRVAVCDVRSACRPLFLTCLDAQKLIEEGMDAFEIKALIEEKTPILEAALIPQELRYLKNGGRISPAAAALANVLKIVPILHIIDGKIDVLDKVRTEKRALATMVNKMVEVDHPEDYYWMVIADERIDEAKQLQKELEERTGQAVFFEEFGAVILSHTGPGTLAIGHIKKIKK